jgi:hypothetical protein
VIAHLGYLKNIRIALHELFERKNCYARLLGIEQTRHRQGKKTEQRGVPRFPQPQEMQYLRVARAALPQRSVASVHDLPALPFGGVTPVVDCSAGRNYRSLFC